MERTKRLQERPITSLLFSFSLPAIVGILVQSMYNVVDRMFIGKFVGPLGLAGVTLSFPVMLVFMAFGMLFSHGAVSLISMKLGAQKRDEANTIFNNAVLILLSNHTLLSIFVLFNIPLILKLLGATPDMYQHSYDYLQIVIAGAVVSAISFGMNNFIRSEGSPKIAMATQLIGAILNVILDAVFIAGFKMGVKGAAIATVLAQICSALWVLTYFFKRDSILKFEWQKMKPQFFIVKKILTFGAPLFLMNVVGSLMQFLFNRQLIFYGGDLAVSSYGIIQSVSIFIIMPVIGISQGMQPIVGHNFGAKLYHRVKEALLKANIIATVIVVLGFLAIFFWSEEIAGLYTSQHGDFIVSTGKAMRLYSLAIFMVGFQIVTSTYFQSIGRPYYSIGLTLTRQALALIPLLFILPRFWGLEGIWLSTPIADILSAVATAFFIFRSLRHLKDD